MQQFQHSFASPHKIARYYAKIAVCALYDEVALYPKPGLVSFIDSGAHQDMDGALFFRSLFGLRHYFFQVGLHAALGYPPHELVRFGLAAEKTMHSITQGINTHRGAIFALGIACTSICKLSTEQKTFSTEDLHQTIIKHWSQYLREIHQNTNTHGTIVKQKYEVHDAKQMAIEGYRLVFNTYHQLLDIQHDKSFFGLLAYQRLLMAMEDINVLYRTGRSGLEFARYHIQQGITLSDREQSIEKAIELHLLFSRKNISPGGVADMLGLIYFLKHVFAGRNK